MSIIQIFIVAFSIFALVRTFFQFRQGRLTRVWLAFWSAFWIIVALVGVLPKTTDIVARFAGVGRGADFVVYISLLIVFYLIFRLFIKIENLEREITLLVRKLALNKKEDKNEHE